MADASRRCVRAAVRLLAVTATVSLLGFGVGSTASASSGNQESGGTTSTSSDLSGSTTTTNNREKNREKN